MTFTTTFYGKSLVNRNPSRNRLLMTERVDHVVRRLQSNCVLTLLDKEVRLRFSGRVEVYRSTVVSLGNNFDGT